MRQDIKSKLIKKIAIPLVGAFLLMLFMIYGLAPYVQKQLFLVGANSSIKSTPECKKYIDQYVEAMKAKQSSATIMDEAKEDKCRK